MDKRIYQLKNKHGLVVEFLSHGARIFSVKVPDKNDLVDILIGYDTPEEAIKGDVYFGAICGRVANRIAKGKFTLDGVEYQLVQNDGENALHGGPNGFQTRYWDVSKIDDNTYKLNLTSPEGEENYPGELKVEVIYSLNNKNEFCIDIAAKTNKSTIVNLTCHPYFNLKGAGKGDVLDHFLQINAYKITPLNETSIPTGEILKVGGTKMDFRNQRLLSDVVKKVDHQINQIGGLNHNWALTKDDMNNKPALKLTEPISGRSVELYTTQPGVQVYTAMHFDGSEKGKKGIPIEAFGGIALEAQNYPDAINHENFPSPILKPGELYCHKIVYKFGF
ncbi:aldose epimerase family protein [Draconibacterium mangrovi]|uniref:aldose epimerase family protein n=1 Tax=Draconibacterium mangrovi TaxID=2697469 RepID=UPI0013D39801|nr:aldose epimerase family protein [Draconibacterium mangrovi]